MSDGRPAWGAADRYHAVDPSVAQGNGRKGPTPTAEKLTALLKEFDPDLKDRVERTVKQWNQIVREYLRNETALRLTVGDDSRSVPIRVADGLPRPFEEIIAEMLDEAWLLLNRPLIEQTARGMRLIQARYEELTIWTPFQPPPATHDEVDHVREYSDRLADLVRKLELLKRISGIDQDILGAYFFLDPKIELYWMVIGVMAATLDVDAEALTVVVLAHELAHAYTHLGRDIDGGRWNTGAFARAELEIVEGLAQFYTAVVCEKLDQRMPAAKEAFTRLLGLQPAPYHAHKEWTQPSEAGGEIVRVTMIQARGRAVTRYDEFKEIVGLHTGHLTGRQGKQRTKPEREEATSHAR